MERERLSDADKEKLIAKFRKIGREVMARHGRDGIADAATRLRQRCAHRAK